MKPTLIPSFLSLAALLLLAGCGSDEIVAPVSTWSSNEVNAYAVDTSAEFGESVKFRGNKRLNYPAFTATFLGSNRVAPARPTAGVENQTQLVERFLISAGETNQTVEWIFDKEEPQPVVFTAAGQNFALFVDSHLFSPRFLEVPLTEQEAADLRDLAPTALPRAQLIYPPGVQPEDLPEDQLPLKKVDVPEGLVIRPLGMATPAPAPSETT